MDQLTSQRVRGAGSGLLCWSARLRPRLSFAKKSTWRLVVAVMWLWLWMKTGRILKSIVRPLGRSVPPALVGWGQVHRLDNHRGRLFGHLHCHLHYYLGCWRNHAKWWWGWVWRHCEVKHIAIFQFRIQNLLPISSLLPPPHLVMLTDRASFNSDLWIRKTVPLAPYLSFHLLISSSCC